MNQFFASGGQSIGSFSFSINPSNECSALISFRIDWFDLLAVQETVKSLLQHHNSKAAIIQHSTFFIVQLSHPYMTTGKIIALTRGTELQYNFIIRAAFIQQSANNKLQNNCKEQDNKRFTLSGYTYPVVIIQHCHHNTKGAMDNT